MLGRRLWLEGLLVVLAGIGVTGHAQTLPAALQHIGVDAQRANIPIEEVLSGGPPPQGIPALGFAGDAQRAATASPAPQFVSQEQAADWLADNEPVIAFHLHGQAKAYPLQILTWHEIVNDDVAGVPVAVTFCPLCNSALAFDRRIPLGAQSLERLAATNAEAAARASLAQADAAFLESYAQQEQHNTSAEQVQAVLETTFGVSGTLYLSNMLMFDDASSTLWSQLLGEGNIGSLTDVRLLRYPAQIVSFADFREAFPEAPVLSRETGFSRNYGRNPYVGYDDIDSPAFLFQGEIDGRLPPKARVISIERAAEVAAYPFDVIREEVVVHDSIADEPIVLFWQTGTASALDQATIASSEDIGAVGVFSRQVDEQVLEFMWDGESFRDSQTSSRWNILGQAVAGTLQGRQLRPIVHDNTLWFAWAAFQPETRIYSVP